MPLSNPIRQYQGHWKYFCKKFWKDFKKSVDTKPPTTNRPQLSALGVSGYTATPLGLYCLDWLMVFILPFYEKKRMQKTVEKHSSGFKPATSRKSARGFETDARFDCSPQQNRYAISKL